MGVSTAKKVTYGQEATDCAALWSACLNVLVGVVMGFLVAGSLPIRAAFLMVLLQMMVQFLAVPIVMGRFILQSDIPKFAYTNEADELSRQEESDVGHRSIADYCGPAHLLARQGALLLYAGIIFQWFWSFWQYQGRLCTDNTFDDWTAKSVGLMIALILAPIEFCCMRWVILPWQQKVKKFTVCGIKMNYWPWLIGSHLLSFVSQVSLQANAHLAGSMLACNHQSDKEVLCALIQSIFVALLCIRPVMTAIYSWPTRNVYDHETGKTKVNSNGKEQTQTVDFVFGHCKDAHGHPFKDELRFSIWAQWLGLTDWESTHFEALTHWACTTKMQCVTPINLTYAGAEMDELLPKEEQEPRSVIRYLRRFQLICRSACFVMFTDGLMKSAVQLFAQVMLWDLLHHYPGQQPQCSQRAIILLNFFVIFAVEIAQVKDVSCRGYEVLSLHKAKVDKALAVAIPHPELRGDCPETVFPSAEKWFWAFLVSSFLALLSWCMTLEWLALL